LTSFHCCCGAHNGYRGEVENSVLQESHHLLTIRKTKGVLALFASLLGDTCKKRKQSGSQPNQILICITILQVFYLAPEGDNKIL
jgi:hypothetical protein